MDSSREAWVRVSSVVLVLLENFTGFAKKKNIQRIASANWRITVRLSMPLNLEFAEEQTRESHYFINFFVSVKCYRGEVFEWIIICIFCAKPRFSINFRLAGLGSHEFLSPGFLVLYSTANDPQSRAQMILDRKWSPLSTVSDPVKSRGIEWILGVDGESAENLHNA